MGRWKWHFKRFFFNVGGAEDEDDSVPVVDALLDIDLVSPGNFAGGTTGGLAGVAVGDIAEVLVARESPDSLGVTALDPSEGDADFGVVALGDLAEITEGLVDTE